jgi:hypothetical protein
VNKAILIQQTFDSGIHVQMLGLSFAHHADYCAQWDWDYWVHSGRVRFWEGEKFLAFKAWGKLALAQQAVLQGYEHIVYIDTDAYISNPKADLREACIKEINMVKFWEKSAIEHFQGGVIYMHNTPELHLYGVLSTLLEEAKYYLERMPHLRGWFEQGQMNELASYSPAYFNELNISVNPVKSP